MNTSKIIAALLVAVFLVSLVPVTVSAESLKDRDQNFIREYNEAKTKYTALENEYKSAREDYKNLRGKVKEFKGLDSKDPAFLKAQLFLSKALDTMDAYNEVLIIWANNIKMAPELRESILDQLEYHTTKIQELNAELDAATTTDNLIETSQKVKTYWEEQQVASKRIAGRLLSARADYVILKADNLAANMQEKIDEKVALGELTTSNKYQTELDDYEAKVDLAEADYDRASEKWQSVTSLADLAPADKEAKQYSRSANQRLKEAHQVLVQMVKEWRKEFGTSPQTAVNESENPYEVVESGHGTVIANGDGLAKLSGSGKLTIVGSGTLKVTERLNSHFSGETKITIDGEEGTKEVVGNTVIYTGFNGEAVVEGSELIVTIDGTDVQFVVTGTGTVMLSGTGTWESGKYKGAWTPMGVQITLSE